MAKSGDRLEKLLLPLSLQTRQADDLAAAQFEVDAAKCRTGVQARNSQYRFARLTPDAGPQPGLGITTHQFQNALFVQSARRLPVADAFAVAQHQDAVTDLLDFGQPVRNEHDPDAGARETPDRVEQILDLRRGERGRRLVQNEQARTARQRASNLHDLLPGCV